MSDLYSNILSSDVSLWEQILQYQPDEGIYLYSLFEKAPDTQDLDKLHITDKIGLTDLILASRSL